jgi:nucleotide-binding universal stress UspA family protein
MTILKNILVLTDFSQNAKSAEEYALQLAIKTHANLILYNAYPKPSPIPGSDNIVWPHDPSASLQLQSISNLQSRVYEMEAELIKIKDDSYMPEIRHLGDEGSLTHKLNDIIVQDNIWLVIMGTKGETFAGNVLFGSNVFKVLDKINCPVLIIPENARFVDVEKIAYATDLRSTDLNIFKYLNELCEILKVDLSIVHVSPDTSSIEETSNKEITEQILYSTHNDRINIKYYQGKSIGQSLHEMIEQTNVGMLAMLYRKYGFFKSLFHESKTHQMVKHTKIPVLVFPDSEN